jgi:hypothetical protein
VDFHAQEAIDTDLPKCAFVLLLPLLPNEGRRRSRFRVQYPPPTSDLHLNRHHAITNEQICILTSCKKSSAFGFEICSIYAHRKLSGNNLGLRMLVSLGRYLEFDSDEYCVISTCSAGSLSYCRAALVIDVHTATNLQALSLRMLVS